MERLDRATRKRLCEAILRGDADGLLLAHQVDKVEEAYLRRLADEAVSAAVARHSAFRRYYRVRIRNPLALVMLAAAVMGLVCFAGAVYLAHYVTWSDPTTYSILGSVAGFCAIGVAGMGWAVAGWVTHRTHRSKLTMDIVAARFSQPAFGEALTAFLRVFRYRRIDAATIQQCDASGTDDERKAVQGLRYLLNYAEFIAVGIIEGELDDRIVARTLRGTLNGIYDRSSTYIRELQADNPRTLEHFSMLRRHYRDL